MKKIRKGLLIILTLACILAGCLGIAACEKKTKYSLVVENTQCGRVALSEISAAEGSIITATLVPDEGYRASGLTVNGAAVEISNNAATFEMPAENVTLTATCAPLFIKEDVPAVSAFRLNAYLNQVMAKSAWRYEFAENSLNISVWVDDREINDDVDGVKIYFGTSETAYGLSSKNVAIEVKRGGKVSTYRGDSGTYETGEVRGLAATVAPWTVDGDTVIGYKVNASLQYSTLRIPSADAAKGTVTMLPELTNGNLTSPVPITVRHADAGYALRPNTYLLLTENNRFVKNARYNESYSFGDVGNLKAGEKWNLEGDAETDGKVTLANSDGKENMLFFRRTRGGSTMYAEATFKITEIYKNERWGKFGFMLFDGGTHNGLYTYVDAYVGGSGETKTENIAGTSLGYNRASNGWGAWTDIAGTNGAFNLKDKTISLKFVYTGTRVYLYSGETLAFSYAYRAGSSAVLGIKSFNYGMELTDYYATTNANDAKYLAHLPPQVDFTNAFTLSGGEITQMQTDMTVTTYTKNFLASAEQKGILYVKNAAPDDAPAYAVSANGSALAGETVYLDANVTCMKYEFDLKEGGNELKFSYISQPENLQLKLVQKSASGESDITGAASTWVSSEKSVSAEKPVYYFLGSSVTYGATTGGTSFVEKVAAALGVTCEKQAVSGTTLAKTNNASYVDRLNNFDKTKKPEKLVVQLSTNDATQNVKLGAVSEGTKKEDFDVSTTVGAIEYIIAYAKETWGADVVFYTNPKYNDASYIKLVSALYEVQEKWGIEIIDFYFYRDMAVVSDSALSAMMSDPIHPNDSGYEWMGRIFSARLRKAFEEKILAKVQD